jgi:hypothetical protein
VNVDLKATESFSIEVAVIPAKAEENKTVDTNSTKDDNSTQGLNETSPLNETALPANSTNSTEEEVENKTEEAKEEVIELKASTFKIETKGMSKAALAKLAD